MPHHHRRRRRLLVLLLLGLPLAGGLAACIGSEADPEVGALTER